MLKPQTIHIDGQEIPYQQNQTVLQAALAAGLAIPHLCYRPELGAIGSCRLCLVEVAGRKVSACTLPAAEGQTIQSDSPALRKLRTNLVAMLLQQGKHVCTQCERSGDCRLQEAAATLAVPAVASSSTPFPANDDSHPAVALNRSRCILCGICIQASRELDGKNLFTFTGSGGGACLTVNSASGLLGDSAISAEDYAVRLCPVGALTVKTVSAEGFGVASFDFFDMAEWGG